MECFLGLAAVLSIAIGCMIIAEILCPSVGLDRQPSSADQRAAEEADAQATYEALSREIERTARDIARQCEGRR